MKKIKNPGKYIKTLKNRLLWVEENAKLQYQRKLDAQGEVIVTWTPFEATQTTVTSFALANLRPKDRIAIIGKVKKVSSSTCAEGNERSEIVYDVLETRRIK
jgi:hypothetical protein